MADVPETRAVGHAIDVPRGVQPVRPDDLGAGAVVALGVNRRVLLLDHRDAVQFGRPRLEVERAVVVGVQVLPIGPAEVSDQQVGDVVAVLEVQRVGPGQSQVGRAQGEGLLGHPAAGGVITDAQVPDVVQRLVRIADQLEVLVGVVDSGLIDPDLVDPRVQHVRLCRQAQPSNGRQGRTPPSPLHDCTYHS